MNVQQILWDNPLEIFPLIFVDWFLAKKRLLLTKQLFFYGDEIEKSVFIVREKISLLSSLFRLVGKLGAC